MFTTTPTTTTLPAATEMDELIQRLPPLPPQCRLTLNFARKWIAAAGGDSAPISDMWYWSGGCWHNLMAHYSGFRELWWAYLEHATTGDPAWAAYLAARYTEMPLGRAFSVIERATVGDPAKAAYYAARDLGMPSKRAIEIIERATTGDPAWAAYLMACAGRMPRKRAFEIIERTEIGDPAWAACCAAHDIRMPRRRVYAVIERAATGDPARAAWYAKQHLRMPCWRARRVIARWCGNVYHYYGRNGRTNPASTASA